MGTLGVGETEPRPCGPPWPSGTCWPRPRCWPRWGRGRIRKARLPQQLAGWNCYPGRVGIRGRMPAELEPSGAFYRTLLAALRTTIGDWEQPARWTLRSICLSTSVTAEAQELQAAIDGLARHGPHRPTGRVAMAQGTEPYLFKQLFVLQGGPGRLRSGD